MPIYSQLFLNCPPHFYINSMPLSSCLLCLLLSSSIYDRICFCNCFLSCLLRMSIVEQLYCFCVLFFSFVGCLLFVALSWIELPVHHLQQPSFIEFKSYSILTFIIDSSHRHNIIRLLIMLYIHLSWHANTKYVILHRWLFARESSTEVKHCRDTRSGKTHCSKKRYQFGRASEFWRKESRY